MTYTKEEAEELKRQVSDFLTQYINMDIVPITEMREDIIKFLKQIEGGEFDKNRLYLIRNGLNHTICNLAAFPFNLEFTIVPRESIRRVK